MQRFWAKIDANEPTPAGRSCLIAAVMILALRNGLRSAILTTALPLAGTTLLAGADRSLVNVHNLAVVATFCLCLAICGEVLRRVRHRKERSALGLLGAARY